MTMDPLQFDSAYYPYASKRNTVHAMNGMVAASQPLASQAGLDMLKQGGNAIDAAIAAAACLTVVEPVSNGVGGDAFALVWTKGKLHGLNASGPASRHISIEAVKNAGHSSMPRYGLIPVTVPGAPSAWAALSKRFGKLPLAEVLKPAISYAKEGYPVTPTIALQWAKLFEQYRDEFKGPEFAAWFRTFAPNGRAPYIGEKWQSPELAATLKAIADSGAEAFYRGELADQIDRFFREYGGFLRKDDLEQFAPEWVEPISVHYRGYDVWEIPPNGQGIVALMALNILKGFDFPEKDSVETWHKQIEAMKLAFADGRNYVTQRDRMGVSVQSLLSEEYAALRRGLIGETALLPEPGKPPRGGTVYLAAADKEGNMVSYIQSNYLSFGSGVVVPGTGIAFQNRGHDFSLDPAHPNRLEPGKKTYHTIIPGFLTKDGRPVGPFGVMGGYMQPQGHVQVIMNSIDFHLNPQAALDAPRWQWVSGKTIHLEHGVPEHIAQALSRKGHDIQWILSPTTFGRGQIIWRDSQGVLIGGTEPRTDGAIAAW